MRLAAESTTKLVTMNGMAMRIWEAETERGVPCHLYVALVAVPEDRDQSQFDAELLASRAPSAEVEAIPLVLLL